MQVRLLGPIDVVIDGVPRPIPGLRRRAILAMLALRRGEVVSTDSLIESVWSDGPPLTLNTIQANVSQLRHLLGLRTAIVARSPGYVLADAEPTDVEQAERLIEEATGTGADQVRQLRAALALWRGPSLVDVAEVPWLDTQARRLDSLRLRAQYALIEARLALGEHAQVLPEVQRLAEGHPLDEQIHGHLIVALYRSGRQAEALEAYERLRDRLRDERGVDPGPALSQLESAILRHDPELAVRAQAAQVPAQLPAGARAFAGRRADLAALDAMLAETGGAAAVATISGGAGFGKTSLAVFWARRVAERFPDGQLYADLRGFDPAGAPLDPADALRGFLEAFGIPATRIPADVDARAALYRSIVDTRRVLVVLDNARDAQQIRPLLPGAPGCVAVVTSRDQLLPLVATEAAQPLILELPDAADARELLARRLGAARVAAEPAAVDDIVARCARLPLALSIVAARAAARPSFPLAAIADELRESGGGLDAFNAGDASTDVRFVFSWSYRALSAGAARLLGLLGLHAGPDIGRPAAASLAGLPGSRVRPLLDELVQASLLAEHVPGRYAFHDLLRAYAAELAVEHEDARRRLYDHYLHSAQATARRLYGPWCDLPLDPPAPGVTPEDPTGIAAANAWFRTEHQVLIAVVNAAAGTGFEAHAWRLAWTMTLSLDSRNLWHEFDQLMEVAHAAATRIADPAGLAYSQQGLGRADAALGRYAEAAAHLKDAEQRFARLGDEAAEGGVHIVHGFLHYRTGTFAAAVDEARRALELFRAAGHLSGQAMALNNLGNGLTELGDYQQALLYCVQAVDLHAQLGALHGRAACWDSLGYVRYRLGQHAEALICYQRAVDLCREAEDRLNEAGSLSRIGDTYEAMGDTSAAAGAWRGALTVLDGLGYPEVEELRTKLHRLT